MFSVSVILIKHYGSSQRRGAVSSWKCTLEHCRTVLKLLMARGTVQNLFFFLHSATWTMALECQEIMKKHVFNLRSPNEHIQLHMF